MCKEPTLWEKAVDFHGHICPGLAIGFKASQLALEVLKESRADDEELVAIVENDACGVDGVMVVTGCTLGKGNLLFKDVGKQVYTFGSRKDRKAVRISVKADLTQGDPSILRLRDRILAGSASQEEREEYAQQRENKISDILAMPAEEFAVITHVDLHLPEKAQRFASIKCGECGEYTMEPRTRNQNGQPVCLDCFKDYTRRL